MATLEKLLRREVRLLGLAGRRLIIVRDDGKISARVAAYALARVLPRSSIRFSPTSGLTATFLEEDIVAHLTALLEGGRAPRRIRILRTVPLALVLGYAEKHELRGEVPHLGDIGLMLEKLQAAQPQTKPALRKSIDFLEQLPKTGAKRHKKGCAENVRMKVKRMQIAFILLIIPAFLASCTTQPVDEQGAWEAHFCPAEDCMGVLRERLSQATEISCAFYDINDPALEALLIRKNADVLVFSENHERLGRPVDSVGLMHDKFCVLDRQTIITGSMNPTGGAATHDNNLVIIEGKALAANYLEEWSELAAGLPGRTKRVRFPLVNHTDSTHAFLVENYFCPEDSCERHVVRALEAAEQNIHFLTYSFTSDPIGDVLVAKQAAGVPVLGVFEKQQESKHSEFTGLRAAGLDVRLDGKPQLMHHKVFVIDPGTVDAAVIFGSYNPTANGNERNDENLLIVHDTGIAALFEAEFQRIWNATRVPTQPE